MKGNGDYLSHIENLDGNHSSYQSTFRGVAVAHPIDKTEIEKLSSCSVMGVIPDPKTMGGNRMRLTSYTRDLRTLTDAFKTRGFTINTMPVSPSIDGSSRVQFF